MISSKRMVTVDFNVRCSMMGIFNSFLVIELSQLEDWVLEQLLIEQLQLSGWWLVQLQLLITSCIGTGVSTQQKPSVVITQSKVYFSFWYIFLAPTSSVSCFF